MGPVDERLGEIDLPATAKVLRDHREDAVDRAGLDPRLIAAMARLVRRIAVWKVRPRRARAQHPEHAVEDVTWVAIRSTTGWPRSIPFVLGKALLDEGPLLVLEIHDSRRSKFRRGVDPLRDSP